MPNTLKNGGDLLIKCPDTGKPAEFVISSAVQIHPKHQAYFEHSRHFRVTASAQTPGGLIAHFLHGIGASLETITDLPCAYQPSLWARRQCVRPRRRGRLLGTLYAADAAPPRRHIVQWPEDAWFQVTLKGRTLWAYDRASALELYDFLASSDRHKKIYFEAKSKGPQPWAHNPFLNRIPGVFLTAKARPDLVRKLGKLLGKPSAA